MFSDLNLHDVDFMFFSVLYECKLNILGFLDCCSDKRRFTISLFKFSDLAINLNQKWKYLLDNHILDIYRYIS